MSRVSIDDDLFSDGRFLALVGVHGLFIALGLVVQSLKLAQTFWKHGSLVPEPLFLAIPGMEDLVLTELAEKKEGGIYVPLFFKYNKGGANAKG